MTTESTNNPTPASGEGSETAVTGTAPGTTQQATTDSSTAPGAQQSNQPSTATDGAQPNTAQQQEPTKDAPKAPENYDLKLPEGMTVSQEVTGKFTELAKKHGLSQDAAQDLYSEISPLMAQHQAAVLTNIDAQWQEQTRSDQEFGGEKLDENVAVAARAIDTFGSPELKELLNKSRLGNHPEVVRFAYRVGKAISEDTLVPNKQNKPGEERNPAKVMFPNQA